MATSSIRSNSVLIKQNLECEEALLCLCWEAKDGNEQFLLKACRNDAYSPSFRHVLRRNNSK